MHVALSNGALTNPMIAASIAKPVFPNAAG